jgi:hypothetical protein
MTQSSNGSGSGSGPASADPFGYGSGTASRSVGTGRSGGAVVGVGGAVRAAPTCPVRFHCPKCGIYVERDAYRGPVTCHTGHGPVFMEPISVLRSSVPPNAWSINRGSERETDYGGVL